MLTVWNQQVQYFHSKHDIEVLDIHKLFITYLSAALGSMRDEGYHVVLGMDVNDDVRDGAVSEKLAAIGIQEAVVSNRKDKCVHTTYARNTQHSG